MIQTANYSLEGFKKLGLTLVFGLLFSFVALAQSEKERVLLDGPKGPESVQQFESPDGANDPSGKSNSPSKTNAPVVKKEVPALKVGGDKDGKKEEISTLSFNLFLYIMDKFKED